MALQLSLLFGVWSSELNYALRQRDDCAPTAHKNGLPFYLPFYLTCVRLFTCGFFSHLWISPHLWFFSSPVNFHRRFTFVHPTSSRHSPALEVDSNYKKNFFPQIQLFFLFSSALTGVQSLRNEEHPKKNAIIVSFERSATVKEGSGDFFRELKALIFSLHVNGSSFVDDIYYTLMRRRKDDVDAIALRCQISWLIILIKMILSYVCMIKHFLFVTATRRRCWSCVFMKSFIFEWYALKNV